MQDHRALKYSMEFSAPCQGNILSLSPSLSLSFFFFFFFFFHPLSIFLFLSTHGMCKFLGQRANQSCSCSLSHAAAILNPHYAKRRLWPILLSFQLQFKFHLVFWNLLYYMISFFLRISIVMRICTTKSVISLYIVFIT